MRCGAAARTRLAATPNWKAPIAAVAVVAALALGVLAAALVKLAGGSESSGAPVTRTIATTPTAGVPTTIPTATVPSVTTTATAPPPTATATTSTPTVKAQPNSAGGLAGPSTAPTITAKTGEGTKSAKSLTPAEQRRIERFIHPGSGGKAGR